MYSVVYYLLNRGMNVSMECFSCISKLSECIFHVLMTSCETKRCIGKRT